MSHCVPLDEGDMVVYHGTELEHWRESLKVICSINSLCIMWIQKVSLRIEFMMADLILD